MTSPIGEAALLPWVWNRAVTLALALAAGLAVAAPAAAVTQSWNGYRWARTGPLSIAIGNNVGSQWTPYFNNAVRSWTAARNIDFVAVAGATQAGSCAPVFGSVQACSADYGATGWLGYANVWLSSGFIVQATVKLNDYYFDLPAYNTSAWRANVTCQEIGHTLGLAHNDTIKSNANKGTCLDYSNDPSGKKGTNGTKVNSRPGATDFAALNVIYQDLDNTQLSATKPRFRIGDGFFLDDDHHHSELVAVPEPGAWALVIAGFGLVGAAQRRRRKTTPAGGMSRPAA